MDKKQASDHVIGGLLGSYHQPLGREGGLGGDILLMNVRGWGSRQVKKFRGNFRKVFAKAARNRHSGVAVRHAMPCGTHSRGGRSD
jgi:hypothetical protein